MAGNDYKIGEKISSIKETLNKLGQSISQDRENYQPNIISKSFDVSPDLSKE